MTFRRLTRNQKGLDQLAFAADRHAGESSIPEAIGYFGFAIEPLRQLLQLGRRNLSVWNPVQKMLKERGRDAVSADLWHRFFLF